MPMQLVPSDLGQHAAARRLEIPDYDPARQQRWHESDAPIAGKHTSQSLQTFDSHGKPNDSKSDHND
ncbi:MAG: hypothetical protein H0W83_00225 [Planctomycetes bacterium]|nr:hypothetical protein [Planctomycetota bacterium]